MNPWALVVIAIGILLIIIGVKGTQHGIAGAVVGHTAGQKPSGNSGGGNVTIL
jgi:hypothetical protein